MVSHRNCGARNNTTYAVSREENEEQRVTEMRSNERERIQKDAPKMSAASREHVYLVNVPLSKIN